MREAIIGRIRTAFHGVKRGQIAIHEAQVIDDYGSDQARAQARALDTEGSWEEIPDELPVDRHRITQNLRPEESSDRLERLLSTRGFMHSDDNLKTRPCARTAFILNIPLFALGSLTGCGIQFSLRDLRSLDRDEKVREPIASRVSVEFRVQVQDLDAGFEPRDATVVRRGGAIWRVNRWNASELLEDSGAFGPLRERAYYGRPDKLILFGPVGSPGSEEDVRVRLTLLLTKGPTSQPRKWLTILSLTTIPTWQTYHRELIAKAWGSEGQKILDKRYDERIVDLTWLPLLVAFPIERLFPAYEGTLCRQLDHCLHDLREALESESAP